MVHTDSVLSGEISVRCDPSVRQKLFCLVHDISVRQKLMLSSENSTRVRQEAHQQLVNGSDMTPQLIVKVNSRLDYCYSLFESISDYSLCRLQNIQVFISHYFQNSRYYKDH